MWLHKENGLTILFSTWTSWDSFPLFIKICFIISMIAIAGIALAMVDIAVQRTKRKRLAKKKALISEKINELLLVTVVMEPSAGKDKNLVDSKLVIQPFYEVGISDKEVRTILVAEMIHYRNYFSGIIAERVRKLYIDLSLHKDAFARLQKKNWETKVNALSELYKMNIEVDNTLLHTLVLDKNRYIREFARLSLICFTKEDPLDFLRTINEPISQWEEYEIFQLFQQKNDFTLGSLEGLIALDKEPTVVSLALKLAVYFKQESAISLIQELVTTPDLKLRGEAIASLGKLGIKGLGKQLVTIYEDQPHEIKLEILCALGKFQSGQYLNFLENEFISSDDFEIKKYASDAIIKLYPLSEITIAKLLDNSEALDHRILSHSLNPLINGI